MTTQALERAARALAACEQSDYEFGDMADHYTKMARAVLMAVREPDEAMSTAGFHSLPGVGDPEREDSNAIWTAMIDAILGEGEGE